WMIVLSPDPSVAHAAHNQFDVSRGGTGNVGVTLSPAVFWPKSVRLWGCARSSAVLCAKGVRLAVVARVRVGDLVRGSDKQPSIGRVTGSETAYVPGCGTRTVVLPTPDGPRRGEVAIETL